MGSWRPDRPRLKERGSIALERFGDPFLSKHAGGLRCPVKYGSKDLREAIFRAVVAADDQRRALSRGCKQRGHASSLAARKDLRNRLDGGVSLGAQLTNARDLPSSVPLAQSSDCCLLRRKQEPRARPCRLLQVVRRRRDLSVHRDACIHAERGATSPG